MNAKNLNCLLIALAAFVAGGILTFIITNGGSTVAPLICPKVDYTNEADFTRITDETAHVLADAYIKDCQPALTRIRPQGADTNQDARSINFSLPILKKYIWELEKVVCTNKSLNVEDLGIRFYYGKYPNLESNPPQDLSNLANRNYSYRHTIFLSPTKRVGEIYQDFNPNNLTNGDLENEMSNNFLMNHGNIYPPPFAQSGETPRAASIRDGLRY